MGQRGTVVVEAGFMGDRSRTSLDAVVRGAHALCHGHPGGFQVMIDELRRATGADAGALLYLEGDGVRPGFASGLQPKVLDTVELSREQPRIAALLAHEGPFTFADDDPRPDPWDGLIADAPQGNVHSCMGCALRFGGRDVGVLTLDVLVPGHFGPELHGPVAAFAAISSLALHGRTQLPPPRSALGAVPSQGGFLGESDGFRQLMRELELVAPTRLPVLILGETGTGKERIAELVHDRSPRADAPLIRLNCATLPSTLAEAELFGHAEGAFTGAPPLAARSVRTRRRR